MSGFLDRFSALHPKWAQPLTSIRSFGNKFGPKRLIKWLGFKTARKIDDAASHFQDGIDTLGDVHTPKTYAVSTVQEATADAILKGKKMSERTIQKWAKGGMTSQRKQEIEAVKQNIEVLKEMLGKLETAASKGEVKKQAALAARRQKHDERIIKLNRNLAKQVLAFPLKRRNAGLMRNVSYSQQVHGVDRYGVAGLQARCEKLKKEGSKGRGTLKQAVHEMHQDMLAAREQAKANLEELKLASKGKSKATIATSQAEVNRLIAFFNTIKTLEGLISSDDAMEGYLAEHGETLGLWDVRGSTFNTNLAAALGIDLDDVADPIVDISASSSVSKHLDDIDVEEYIVPSSKPQKNYGTFSQAPEPTQLKTDSGSSVNPSWNTGMLTPTPASPTGSGKLRREDSTGSIPIDDNPFNTQADE
ncbi:MAG: hypothetical protein ACR2PT_03450 [Endozoicomonas sp.]